MHTSNTNRFAERILIPKFSLSNISNIFYQQSLKYFSSNKRPIEIRKVIEAFINTPSGMDHTFNEIVSH